MATQPAFEEFRPIYLQVPPSRLESTEGFPFEFEMGRRMVHELNIKINYSLRKCRMRMKSSRVAQHN
jgi:hypothetical protein